MSDETDNTAPSPTESNGEQAEAGRAANGRFATGNHFSRGNPHAARVQALRAVLMDVATPERMRAAAEQIMRQAEAGDRLAFAELCDRLLGKAVAADLLQQIEELESAVEDIHNERRNQKQN